VNTTFSAILTFRLSITAAVGEIFTPRYIAATDFIADLRRHAHRELVLPR
jgi:hypothetical protein